MAISISIKTSEDLDLARLALGVEAPSEQLVITGTKVTVISMNDFAYDIAKLCDASANKKIPAIKMMRTVYPDLSLLEAKNLVDTAFETFVKRYHD